MEHTKESNKGMMLVIGQWPFVNHHSALVIGRWLGFLLLLGFISSCSLSRQIGIQANDILLKDTAISTGHIGISIYEPATNKYWYNYNATHYFIPASNTKLFTLYAGMKYLGDSLVGINYQNFSDSAINVIGTGDPTFLHPDFKNQPALDFLKSQNRTIYLSGIYKGNALGYGWAWDDYNDDYMVESNAFPVYGNVVTVSLDGYKKEEIFYIEPDWKPTPKYFENLLPDYRSLELKYKTDAGLNKIDSNKTQLLTKSFTIERNRTGNNFSIVSGTTVFKKQTIPFYTNGVKTAVDILKNDFNLKIKEGSLGDNSLYPGIPDHLAWHSVKTQASDSMFKKMMHRSDNFFAEQTLVMTSKVRWWSFNEMNETAVLLDSILSQDLKDIPQKPKWVDGSGLSRYNLFTPQSFVYILNKTKNEFGWERLKKILPTGSTGTLSSYYKKDSGFIYAKTGTLSNNCALSGVLFTRKGKLLIFSLLANNYITGAAPVRRSVEKFLLAIRENY